MKRQTLLVLAILALVTLLQALLLGALGRPFQPQGPDREIAVGAFTLQVPGTCGPPRLRKDGPWHIQDLACSGLGRLRLAVAPGDGTPPQDLASRWYDLPPLQGGVLQVRRGSARWHAQHLDLHGPAFYALRREGKQARWFVILEREGQRHWIGLDSREPTPAGMARFHGLLRTLRTQEGSLPGRELEVGLEGAAAATRWRLLVPTEAILALPIVLTAGVILIQAWVMRRSGRLPVQTSGTPWFQQAGVEVGLIRPWQRRFMEAAVIVDAAGLTVHTFGRPLFRIEPGTWRGRLQVGTAWLGQPYVQLDLPTPPTPLRRTWILDRLRGPLSVRFYTPEADRLRACLP